MSSYVTGSLLHVSGGKSGTLGAAVQLGDVIIVSCSGTTTFPTACGDSLGNTYTLQQSCTSGEVTTNTVFTALVTFPGTPVITVTSAASTASITITCAAFRGLASATPNQKGSAQFTSANPLVVPKTTTVQCMGWVTWINEGSGGSYTSFTLGATQLNFDNADFDANGYLLGQAAGSYSLGANFTTGDSQDSVVVLWLPETVIPVLPATTPFRRTIGYTW